VKAALAGPAPMGMLLQGDVGTGKTAVAMFAALAVIGNGMQVAFLAPTELLAEQHMASLSSWLAGSAVRTALVTAQLGADARSAVDAEVASGRAQLVFGTHALLSERTRFARLGLVVIDEQHRFGVEQRMTMVAKGDAPHVLVLSATPIPRTLSLSLFGDLDAVTLREKPPGRRATPAVHVEPREWGRVVRAIGRHVRRGGRVFVVCPKVGEDGERGGTVRVCAALASKFRCGVVHGRMPARERIAVTDAFRRGEVDVLVGTTVLEVGVDVAAATLIVVVAAEQFGLATLHQLRGRVGRGGRRGLCVLTGARNDRVDALCATTDGFELAEADLRLRGAGELLGTRQSGVGELRAFDPVGDLELLLRVRRASRGQVGV
jgi:ATP-dependent DNA helicase RecG